MTRDDPFERDLSTVVRSGAPDVAPTELRRRLETSMAADSTRRRRQWRIWSFGAAVGVVALFVAVSFGGPLLAPRSSTPTQAAVGPPTTGPQSPAAPTATPGITAPPLAEPVTDPGQVQEGQLFTPNDGWVLNASSRLFMTNSAGSAWRDITPPGLSSDDPLVNAFFVDSMHGWLSAFDRQVDATLVIWRTTDSGQTWSRSVLPDVLLGNWDLVFQTQMVGWLATDPGGQHPKPELRWTDDGGATWSDPIDLRIATGIPTLPDLAFADRNHGVLAAGDVVRATTDGGRTWSGVGQPSVPSPATTAGDAINFSWPTFVDAEHGFLVKMVTTPEPSISTEFIYATSTAGSSWHLALQDNLRRKWSFVTANTWVGLSDGQVWMTADAGKTFFARASVGLPTPLDRASMTFVDPEHGWGQALRGGCPPNGFGCLRGPELFATSDGGQFWTRIGDCIFECDSPTSS
jgi:photosystem II stability/assembly factor-like uncharacterized protein